MAAVAKSGAAMGSSGTASSSSSDASTTASSTAGSLAVSARERSGGPSKSHRRHRGRHHRRRGCGLRAAAGWVLVWSAQANVECLLMPIGAAPNFHDTTTNWLHAMASWARRELLLQTVITRHHTTVVSCARGQAYSCCIDALLLADACREMCAFLSTLQWRRACATGGGSESGRRRLT
jgi:hypothetical protein